MNVVEGGAMAARLTVLGAKTNQIHTAPFNVDPIKNIPRSVNSTLRFLIASTLKEKKGVDIALDVLKQLSEKSGMPKFEVTIIGQGPMQASLAQFSQKCSFNVDFKGYMPLSDLRETMTKHDMFFATSRIANNYDSEGGAPVTILHALAASLPIVTTFVDDIPSIVLDGFNGVIFNHNYSAEGVRKLMDVFIGGRLNEMKINARKSSEPRASIESNMNTLYDRLLSI